MKRLFRTLQCLLLALVCVACADNVSFNVETIPSIEGLDAEVNPVRNGKEWVVDVRVKNNSDSTCTFKVRLAAEPRFVAKSYLFPGINYNGNKFGDNVNLPQGWEHNGEPWIFSYDRGSIPSCTISENEDKVFGLFVSDVTPESYQSACSMELLEDGSFRHIIYWPVTEAPLTYSNKLKFTGRYDTYLTLAPGEEFAGRAIAFMGKPKRENYGFAEIFPVAWRISTTKSPRSARSRRLCDSIRHFRIGAVVKMIRVIGMMPVLMTRPSALATIRRVWVNLWMAIPLRITTNIPS